MPDKTPKERLTELKKRLDSLSDEHKATQFVYLKQGPMNDRDAFHRLNIDDGLAKRIAKATRDTLSQKIGEALEQDDGLVEIGTTDLPRDTIGYIDISHFDVAGDGAAPDQDNSLHDLLTAFPGTSHDKLLGNDLETHAAKISLTASNISLGTAENLISICRQGKSTFMRNKNILMRRMNEGALVEAKDIFELRDATDFFIWDGVIWVLNERSFENTLGFNELTQTRANSALDKIAEKLDFEDPDMLRAKVLAGKRASRIAAQLAGESYLDNINNEDFISYCKTHDLSGWKVGDNGKIQLEETSSAVVTRLLDAISQNYFEGGLGGGSYKATGKVKRP